MFRQDVFSDYEDNFHVRYLQNFLHKFKKFGFEDYFSRNMFLHVQTIPLFNEVTKK
jgi:hypothetical protein